MANPMSKKDSGAKIEIESFYKGGDKGWAGYLSKKMQYPERAFNNNVSGFVIVFFTVTSEGKVENAYIEKSVEYSLDREALRIIRLSNEWIPAQQNGRKVKSYKRQPLVFSLQQQ
jgi:periplasmic protein TonB